MAIEHIAFSNTTSRDSMYNDLYNFLTTYAAEYFDEITKDDDRKFIYCKIDGVNVITFKCAAGTGDVLSTVAGSAVTLLGVSSQVTYYRGAYVTSRGFALDPASRNNFNMLMIFKDNNGSTCVHTVYNHNTTTTNLAATHILGSFKNQTSLTSFVSPTASNEYDIPSQGYRAIAYPRAATSFAHVPVSQNYIGIGEGVYFTPFTQYLGTVGIIELDGKRYVYDGAFALEE